mgnify:CR=1 FL=1
MPSRDVIDRLDTLGVATDVLRLMGGGARSELWCRMRSDAVGRPAEVLTEDDASAVGAGMLAAVAAKLVPDLASATAALRLDLREIAPDPALRSIYDEAYDLYRRRFAALEPSWRPA